jgi:hypothetical protein
VIYVTLILSDNDWNKVLNAAAVYWPSQKIDAVMRRQESIRRLLLSGIDQLRCASASERQNAVTSYARVLQPPGSRSASNEEIELNPGGNQSRGVTKPVVDLFPTIGWIIQE